LEVVKTIFQRQNPKMQTFTTKGATDLLYADDYRSNGCPDVWCLQNESGTVELEALTQEVESALEELEPEIESDVIPDQIMTSTFWRM
jgi:hypothetical protein